MLNTGRNRWASITPRTRAKPHWTAVSPMYCPMTWVCFAPKTFRSPTSFAREDERQTARFMKLTQAMKRTSSAVLIRI